MPGTDIDLGELWVRMLCFEDCKRSACKQLKAARRHIHSRAVPDQEHWLSHDLELYSHRSSMGSCAWDINSKGQFPVLRNGFAFGAVPAARSAELSFANTLPDIWETSGSRRGHLRGKSCSDA